MATDTKKHSTIAAGESPTRAALAAAILSINDAIPVANATEATQVVVALASQGQSIATNPVIVTRADARGLHRTEITYDPAGLVWVPVSGVLSFATKPAADSFGASSGSLLTVNDECRVGNTRYAWSGSAWVPMFAAIKARRASPQSCPTGSFTTILWDVEDFDSGNFRAAGAPGDLVAPVAGIYHIDATAGLSNPISGRTALQFQKNGAVEFGGQLVPTGNAGEVAAQASTLVSMAAGDVLRVQLYQESGAGQNTGVSGYAMPTVAMFLVGGL